MKKPLARSASTRSPSSARFSSISRARSTPGSRPRESGGVTSLPPRSTNRLVKLPSVRKPSGSRNSSFERAGGFARLVVKGAVAGLVPEAKIVRRDRNRSDGDLDRRFGLRLERPHQNRERAAPREHQPHLARPGAEGRGLEVVARLVPVEREIERLRARAHPGEVAIEIGDAVARVEAHRLDEVEAPLGLHERPFRQTFAPLVLGAAVRHDAGAEPQPGDRLARAQGQRPDRDIERGFAAACKPSDRAAIDAARRSLEPGDDLHRPDLGRAGDRAARIDGAEHVDRAEAVLELGGDGRGHLQDGRIGLDREQLGHLDAARFGDSRQIVAQEIDDHQVFGALLGIACERRGVGVARGGALHRPGRHIAALEREEELRREGEDPVGAGEDDAAMAGPRLGAERGIKRER